MRPHIYFQWDNDIGPLLVFQLSGKKYILCICHRKKDRSIKFFGLEKVLCSRCMGILFGFTTGIGLSIIKFQIPPFFAIVLIIPLIVDGFTQLFNLRESNNTIRLISGFLFGVALIPLFSLMY